MKSESNKVMNRVTKRVLSPMGFIRLSDRLWAHDGGWWFALLVFDASSYSKGCYAEVGLQCFLHSGKGWILQGVKSPRLRTEYIGDDHLFETEFGDAIEQLLPIALDLVNRINTPGDLLKQLEGQNLLNHPQFFTGMLYGLEGDIEVAADVFERVIERDVANCFQLAERHAATLARQLLSSRSSFLDFADYITYEARSQAVHGITAKRPCVLPWR